jgi:hypothetical protein
MHHLSGCTVPKRNSDPRNQRSEYQDIDKLTQLVFDMKAEMGSMRKAIIRSGISFDKIPNEQKQKEISANGKQKNNFAGTAKMKNRKDQVTQRFLVAVEEKESVSYSDEDNQPEFRGFATVIKLKSIWAHDLSMPILEWLE